MAVIQNEKRWEISIIELYNHVGPLFKVSRRIPEQSIAETLFFRSKEEARRQFEEWLN